jgi:hypothetical protein
MMKRNIVIMLGLLFLLALPLTVLMAKQPQAIQQDAASGEVLAPQYPFGKAVEIKAGNNAISAEPVLPGTLFTVDLWVRLQPFTSAKPEVRTILTQSGKGSDLFTLQVTGDQTTGGGMSGTPLIIVQQGTKIVTLPATVTVSVATWHHVAVIKNETEIKLFLDGILIAEKPFTPVLDFTRAEALTLGATPTTTPDTFTNQLQGALDEVRISDTARYADSFIAPLLPATADKNTIALWHFTGDTADSSGQIHIAQTYGTISFIDALIGVTVLPTVTPFPKAPGVSFLAPVAGVTIYHPVIPVSLSIDGTNILDVTVTADGKTVCVIKQEPYSCNWTTGERGKVHILEATVTDGFGNTTAASISVNPQ